MRWKKGYTIIEILVALSIAGILFGAGFVSFRDFSRRQVLAGVLRNLKADLRLTQEYASIGKKPEGDCDEPSLLNGYRFFRVSESQYAIRAYCSGGTVDVKVVDLPADIIISAPSPNPITFKTIGEGTDLASDAVVTLTQISTSTTLSLTVTPGGEIK